MKMNTNETAARTLIHRILSVPPIGNRLFRRLATGSACPGNNLPWSPAIREGRNHTAVGPVPSPEFPKVGAGASTGNGKRHAFTLIEIMVVVVILGILAATIIPQFMGTTQDAKISAAKSQVAELESAIERFYVHMDRYPTTEEGLNVLVTAPAGDESKWRGPYIKMLRADPWGNAYQYVIPGTHHTTSFDLWSRGADGQDGGDGPNADIGNW